MMNIEKLVDDLKKILTSKPDKVGNFGESYHLFSENEIKGIIEILEMKKR